MSSFTPTPETLQQFKDVLIESLDLDAGDNQIANFIFGQGVKFDDFGADSITRFEAINALEDSFDVTLDDEAITPAKNLDDVLWLIAYMIEETSEVPSFLAGTGVTPKR
jgi:acyl carrier protein